MFFKVFFLYILAGVIVVHICSTKCVPKECLKCSIVGANMTGSCNKICSGQCANASDVEESCKRGFNVSINGSGSDVEEAERVSLTCVHDLPDQLNVTYEWRKDKEIIEGQQKSEFIIEKTFHKNVGEYVCVVHSDCGSYMSTPHSVTVHNSNIIILVICGCAALALVVIMGVSMKIKIHRDKVKNQLRTRQRLQEMQRAQNLQPPGPAPNPTPTSTK